MKNAKRGAQKAPKKKDGRRALAVATGSLWVPAAYLLTLAKAWERVAEMQHHDAYEAQARDNCMTIATSTAHAKADAIAGCAKELRSLVEDASERQPTENTKGSRAEERE